ncbi:docking protein 3 [Neocloeon triangulifer]|uniref:docking protein 3 n=1 Tax=Neocloeon triangulifer TaxID=2078957 RepID=UPI00286EE7B4|nr:docking protein 3 [Neocloeon triangulifer]
MDLETPYKEGFMLVPLQSGLLKKKTWHKRYCKLFKATKHGLQRLEIFETDADSTWKNNIIKFVTLDNCIKISPNPQKNQPLSFSILARGFTQDFAALSDSELYEWVSCFQSAAFDKDDGSRPSSGVDEFEESNDLYCSANEGVFTVQVIPTTASKRCNLVDADYTLVVTRNALQLRTSLPNERLLYTWPFMYIRKYGSKNGILSFDAGRKCDSGEGTFQLKTDQQKGVFQCISTTMKNWRQMAKNDESQLQLSSSQSMIVCGDSQFQAALSMEPGSRTPLPPSPTTATNSSLGIMAEFNSAIENSSKNKQKPRKPPRKTTNISQPKEYDHVEVINHAWKTLGIDDLMHTEHVTNDDVETNVRKLNTFMEEAPLNKQRTFISQPSVESLEDYDTLQHFAAPSANIKFTNDMGLYSQVNEAPPPVVPKKVEAPEPLSWNEYDVIGVDSQERFRVADDSHQGYGSIRKVSPQPQVANSVYAEVVKPKKV